MAESIDRRRFLAVSMGGTAAMAIGLATVPLVPGVAGATPSPTQGPNLVFDATFSRTGLGESPLGWTIH